MSLPLHLNAGKRFITVMVSLAMFMEGLDATILNTAIPTMATSLQVNPVDLKIALIGYLLSLAVFIPISGWLADKFGIKQVFMAALAFFTLSSLACGFSQHLPALIVARVIQGFGAALMMPVGRLLILRSFPREVLIHTMNRVVIVGALGMMFGPVLGGLITYHFSWPWIFWVNVPIGVVMLVLVALRLNPIAPVLVPPLDAVGFLLFGLGAGALTFGLSALSETIFPLRLALGLLALALAALVAYWYHSRHRLHPIINSQLFTYRSFAIAVGVNLWIRIGIGGLPFLVPLLLQLVFGYSTQTAGLLLAPLALGVVAVKPLSMKLLRWLGYKKLLFINTLMLSGVMLAYAALTATTPFVVIAGLTFVLGLLQSSQYSAMNSLAYADVPPVQLSAASSVLSVAQQLAQSLGVAVAALLLQYLSTAASVVFDRASFQTVFIALALITAASVSVIARLQSQDGATLL